MIAHLILVLALLVLVAILALVWISVRAAMSEDVAEENEDASAERATLLEEKKSILRALKDLEFERGVGKISDADYAAMESSLRTRAKHVLQALDDDLEPWRKKAEELVANAQKEGAL